MDIVTSILFILGLWLIRTIDEWITAAKMWKKGYRPCFICYEWGEPSLVTPAVVIPEQRVVLICVKCKLKLIKDGKLKEVTDEL
jgi:hypothetical protein